MPTSVQILDLTDIPPVSSEGFTISGELTGDWLANVCRFKRVSPGDSLVFKELVSRIIPRKYFVSLRYNGETAACGLGVNEADYMGLFDIVVAESYRHQGLGRKLVMNLLQLAKKSGATKAYLQVVANNLPAIGLYAQLGFKEIYQYWYRVKR